MAINLANRYDDARRTKYRRVQLPYSREALTQHILDDIARRPDPLYQADEIVYTPDGYKEITSRFYSYQGWHYRVWNRRYSKSYLEKDLSPLLYQVGDVVQLPSGVHHAIHKISISASGNVLLIFQISEKQFSIYRYNDLLAVSPPSAVKLMRVVWRTFIDLQGNPSYIKDIAEAIAPDLQTRTKDTKLENPRERR